MALVTRKAVDAAVDRGNPDCAYLLFGDDDFLKEEAVHDLIQRLVDPGTRDFNLDIIRGPDADPATLATMFAAMPMLAPRRVVVVRDFDQARKPVRAIVDRHLERTPPDVVTILVAAGGWKPDASLIGQVSAVDFSAPTVAEAIEWSTAHCAHLGTTIEPDAARFLVTHIGPDLRALDCELRKLQDYSGPATITTTMVAAVAGAVAGRGATDLIDHVCHGNAVAASAMVADYLAQPKASAVGLVMSLTVHILAIGQAHVDQARGANARQQASNLYGLFGEARSAPVGRPWGEAVSVVMKAAPRWDARDVRAALLALHEADSRLKDTTVSADEEIVESLLLTIAAQTRKRGRAA